MAFDDVRKRELLDPAGFDHYAVRLNVERVELHVRVGQKLKRCWDLGRGSQAHQVELERRIVYATKGVGIRSERSQDVAVAARSRFGARRGIGHRRFAAQGRCIEPPEWSMNAAEAPVGSVVTVQ